jgi:hypothetical protein
MARIIEHIDRLREKPEHVRHTIAFGVAIGISGLVAVGWMTALATSGTLALETDQPVIEDSATKALAESTYAFSNLMGAASAAFTATSTEAALNIIETRTSSTLNTSATESSTGAGKTIIPF